MTWDPTRSTSGNDHLRNGAVVPDCLVLEVEGTPRSVGLAHGEALRAAIQDLTELRIGLLRKASSWTATELDVLADQLWAVQRATVPGVHEEIDGIRVGADLTRLEVLVAGALSDIVDIAAGPDRGVAGRFAECTTVVSRTDPDRPLLFGTWDTQPGAQPSLVAIRRRVTDEVEVVGLTSAGTPIQQFVNTAGVAGAINNLKPTTAGVGLLFPAALAGTCSARTVRHAAQVLRSFRYASGHYYPLLDRSVGLGIETTAAGAAIVGLDNNGRVVHTNHYLAPGLIADGVTYHDTVERLQFAITALAAHPIDSAGSAWDVLQQRPGQIGHARLARDEPEVRTCAGFVIDPVSRSVEFTVGPPGPGVTRHTIAVSASL